MATHWALLLLHASGLHQRMYFQSRGAAELVGGQIGWERVELTDISDWRAASKDMKYLLSLWKEARPGSWLFNKDHWDRVGACPSLSDARAFASLLSSHQKVQIERYSSASGRMETVTIVEKKEGV
jgi:hypothetical protein